MKKQDTITVSAPGKIHLMGEHAVVYGKPAFFAAIDKRCFVTLAKRKDKKIILTVNSTSDSATITEKEILTKNKTVSQPFDYVILILQQTLRYYDKHFPSGFSLVIDNQIPEGRGLGSSAALAAAIAGTITLFLKEDFDKEKINEIAYLSEHFVHGTPSGGDNSAAVFGGFVWYRKETKDLKFIQQIPFALSEKMQHNFFLLDTGQPSETTGEMVTKVKSQMSNVKNKKRMFNIFNEQEQITKNMVGALQYNNEEKLIELIRRGERNLEKIGVVSDDAKKIISLIEKIGGAAKICGGGGKKKGTGVLLAYHPEIDRIKNFLLSKNVPFYDIILGREGLTIT